MRRNTSRTPLTGAINLPVDLVDEMRTATARSGIALDLLVPLFLCQLFKPVGKLLAFRLGEVNNRFLDSFQGHTLTIA